MKKFFAFFVLLLIVLVVFLSPISTSAQVNPQDLQNVEQQISDLTSKLNTAKDQEKTLQSQLDYINTQSKLTELKITQTNTDLEQLQSEISDLSGKITQLSSTISTLTQILLNRIIETYKYGNPSPLELIFSSKGFSDLLMATKYLEVAQENDKRILYQLQATKSAYHDQKINKETRQQQVEKLKADLQSYQNQLNQNEAAKAALLRMTQDNEAIYQQKLKAAQEEQNAILAIINGQGNEVQEGQVHKGDTIGTIISGPSPCSTGTHLHFEVHQNGNIMNPTRFLANHSVTFANSPDGPFSFSGSWDLWPVSDPIIITQGFGNTWWAQHGWYTDPPGHTGVDMYSSISLSVRAVQDGTLYVGGISCGSGILHYKRVDQGNGISTYYLHVL